MRLPEGLREPPWFPRGWWIAGTGVIVVVAFVALAMPWDDIGRRVRDSDLPHPRFHAPRWGAEGCIDNGDYYVISIDRHGVPGGFGSVTADTETAILPDGLEAWIRRRDEERGGRGALLLRVDRRAPWDSVAEILASAVRTGHDCVRLQVGGWNFLRLYLVADAPGPPAEEVTIAALPLPDPEGTLAAARERERAKSPGPVLRLAFEGDPDVESVLHALECFAGEDASVRLATRR